MNEHTPVNVLTACMQVNYNIILTRWLSYKNDVGLKSWPIGLRFSQALSFEISLNSYSLTTMVMGSNPALLK